MERLLVRLREWLGVESHVPAAPAAPATTSQEERREIDARLSRQEADLGGLLARAGLDELRQRDRWQEADRAP